MISGAMVLSGLVVVMIFITPTWPVFLGVWALLGLGYAATVAPQGRLLRRSAHSEDRQSVFTAQFALSHACWLITYPVAGASMTVLGMASTMAVLSVFCIIGVSLALWLWPEGDPVTVVHSHPDLPDDHPHLKGQGHTHAHALVIDDEHESWPTKS